MLKRELKRAALDRLENAARTLEDFKKVICRMGQKLASNEARRLRDHDVSRGDVLLEYGKAMDGAIFPAYFMEPRQRQLMSGNFIDLIHDCPFELHELTADAALSGMLRRALAARVRTRRGLSIRQRAFLEGEKNAALDGGGDG